MGIDCLRGGGPCPLVLEGSGPKILMGVFRDIKCYAHFPRSFGVRFRSSEDWFDALDCEKVRHVDGRSGRHCDDYAGAIWLSGARHSADATIEDRYRFR